MFDSLNEEIQKKAGDENPRVRLLRYAGVALAAILFVWAMYAGILALE